MNSMHVTMPCLNPCFNVLLYEFCTILQYLLVLQCLYEYSTDHSHSYYRGRWGNRLVWFSQNHGYIPHKRSQPGKSGHFDHFASSGYGHADAKMSFCMNSLHMLQCLLVWTVYTCFNVFLWILDTYGNLSLYEFSTHYASSCVHSIHMLECMHVCSLYSHYNVVWFEFYTQGRSVQQCAHYITFEENIWSLLIATGAIYLAQTMKSDQY